ncbi:MAG: HAD-IA family hydrolase [Alphaproteobacteria bacterium]|nr:HAD-IA family hydrolase [Alphaproteobacteria bacterium]
MSGGVLLPGARWLVENLGDRMVIVSNDAEHMPDALSHVLSGLGVDLDPDDIVLAGTTAIEEAAKHFSGARAMLMMSPELKDFAREKGLRPTTEDCDLVLVGRDRSFTYDSLARAAAAIAGGVPLWLSCPDTSHRGPAGEPVPEAGAIGAAIMAAAGVSICHVVGKPEPVLFEKACARLGLPPDRVVMIGDNRATDGAGAEALGMSFVEVRPGELGPGLFEPAAERA